MYPYNRLSLSMYDITIIAGECEWGFESDIVHFMVVIWVSLSNIIVFAVAVMNPIVIHLVSKSGHNGAFRDFFHQIWHSIISLLFIRMAASMEHHGVYQVNFISWCGFYTMWVFLPNSRTDNVKISLAFTPLRFVWET